MKITKLELKNFKRFDDLTIDLTALAEPAKLVLMIGTNGSGKSSVFDAFEAANKLVRSDLTIGEKELSVYYDKNKRKHYEVDIHFDKGRSFHSSFFSVGNNEIPATAFYGRSSIRQVPLLTRTYIGDNPLSFQKDADRPKIFIERDNRFENDVEDVMTSIIKDVFSDQNTSTSVIKKSYIDPINSAFENIFGAEESLTIRLMSFKPPSNGKTAEILFEKGKSKIPYDHLSSGEKEIFNIMLNLLARGKHFNDTVYFLDEIDLHLNTYLQKNLLKEITENWIPDNCQLWIASHSLGFKDYANETKNAAIIDFDNLNFDIPQVITPSQKNNFDIFEIAVGKDFLSKLFKGKKIIFSENTDTPLYNNLNIKDTVFFNAKDKADVFHKSKNNPDYNGLIDRDYLTDEERADLLGQYKNLHILNYYSIENYFFHPDNLEEYYASVGKEFNKTEYLNAIVSEAKIIRDKILLGLAVARDSYPFYREHENAARLKSFRSNGEAILHLFDSEHFESFYKVFPAKDYGNQLKPRQNINPADLAKTKWFKVKIKEALLK